MSDDGTCKNTDRELWRAVEGDYYADSVHVTEGGAIGIDCGGRVIVCTPRMWQERSSKLVSIASIEVDWKMGVVSAQEAMKQIAAVLDRREH